MPNRMGLLGKKVGMLQDFDEKGVWASYSVVEVGPCVVVDIKTQARDGYSAIKLGFDDQKPHRVNKPEKGVFAKADTAPKRYVREIRLSEEECAQFKVGQTLSLDEVFQDNDTLDIIGTSKGKGYQGVMKRHNFHGTHATHGAHEVYRHGGSIGCRLTPGHTVKGRKMAGQMGNKRVTVQNIGIGRLVADKNLLLLKGAVPGAPGSYVTLKHASKRLLPPFELIQSAPAQEEKAEAAEKTEDA